MNQKKNIIIVIARGESVRNFLFTNTIKELSKSAKITLLSVIHDNDFIDMCNAYVEKVIPLQKYDENPIVSYLRRVIHTAHYRWIWNNFAKWNYQIHDYQSRTKIDKIKRMILKSLARIISNRLMLEFMSTIEKYLSWVFRPKNNLEDLFMTIKPELVFNSSHIHGELADFPMRIAKKLGFKTSTFIFSWDNLYGRSRIFVPYDYYLVWNEIMKLQLLNQYRKLKPENIIITGTPQFDFHFDKSFTSNRKDFCAKMGLDPDRPYILYTTGMNIWEEDKIVECVINFINNNELHPKPQLVVRTYIKGTTIEMKNLSQKYNKDVFFPEVLWEPKWLMPKEEDLYIYSNLLLHSSLGINCESTVSLELMMFDKPVINIGFDPDGSQLPPFLKLSRYINADHYMPVIASGAVKVAYSEEALHELIINGLQNPQEQKEQREKFLRSMFGDTLDGKSGSRVSEVLINLASLSTQ